MYLYPGPSNEPVDPPSKEHLGLLYGKLKACGVRDGDKRKLIEFAYPAGVSKQAVSGMIEDLGNGQTLPSWLRTPYVRFLVKTHGLDRKVVAEYMDKTFSLHDPTLLDHEQFLELIDYLVPKAEAEADDIYYPGEVTTAMTTQEWNEYIRETCTACQITAGHFEAWVMSQFGNGIAKGMTQLPREVYNSLRALDIDKISEEVAAFHTEEELQETLSI